MEAAAAASRSRTWGTASRDGRAHRLHDQLPVPPALASGLVSTALSLEACPGPSPETVPLAASQAFQETTGSTVLKSRWSPGPTSH